jgi:tetratricopeptide (TPR) repeat protein
MNLFRSRASSDARDVGRDYVRRADQARDARQFARAAFLYEEALRHLPQRDDLYVQHGHMLKEAGDPAGAEQAYRLAAERMPRDADLALQMGHLFKSQGEIARAEEQYRRALKLRPKWAEAEREIASLAQSGWSRPELQAEMPLWRDDRASNYAAGELLQLSADLAPGSPLQALESYREEIAVRSLGRRERTAWGVLPTLRGVRAIRGFCVSEQPVLTVELFLNRQLIYRGRPAGGYALPHERNNPRFRRYTFNAWIDLTGFATARYDLHYRAVRLDGSTLERTESIVVAPPVP